MSTGFAQRYSHTYTVFFHRNAEKPSRALHAASSILTLLMCFTVRQSRREEDGAILTHRFAVPRNVACHAQCHSAGIVRSVHWISTLRSGHWFQIGRKTRSLPMWEAFRLQKCLAPACDRGAALTVHLAPLLYGHNSQNFPLSPLDSLRSLVASHRTYCAFTCGRFGIHASRVSRATSRD
jgi:hypothetical protein